MEEEKYRDLYPPADRSTIWPMESSSLLRVPNGFHSVSDNVADIFEFLPDPTFAVDIEGRITAWNRAIEEMTGVGRSEVLGKGEYIYAVPFYGIARPIVVDFALGRVTGLEPLYASLDKSGEVCSGEAFCPLVNKGKGAILRAKAAPLYDLEGRIVGAVESIQDITAQRQAEEKLRESEEKYRQIFKHTPLGIFHFDANGVVTDCNKRIIEIWGSSREKFIGFNLLSSLKNKKMKAAVKSCISGRCSCYEGNYLSVTGGKISYLKADYGPITSADGSVTGGIAIIEDVSDRKKEEEVLQESESRLRCLSAQLLSNREGERKAIADGIHNGLETALTGIKFSLENSLELARKGRFQYEELKSIVQVVQQALDQSRRIITDLRPSMLDDLGLLTTVGWFARRFQALNPDINVELLLEIEEGEIPEDLKVVIFRIVEDAFSNIARHSGATQAAVRLARVEDSLHLQVRDNGHGFDPAALPGTGLGILSMKERAELSCGWMEIQSQEGLGTLIKAYLPANCRK